MRKISKTTPEHHEHPEVNEVKNICKVTPGSQSTKNVCDVVKEGLQKKKSSKHQE